MGPALGPRGGTGRTVARPNVPAPPAGPAAIAGVGDGAFEQVFDRLSSVTSGYEERHRRPVSLRGEQLAGAPVTPARQPVEVLAWVVWPGGRQEQVRGVVTEWTSRAVHVRWKAGHRIEHEAWVWANAVERVGDVPAG